MIRKFLIAAVLIAIVIAVSLYASGIFGENWGLKIEATSGGDITQGNLVTISIDAPRAAKVAFALPGARIPAGGWYDIGDGFPLDLSLTFGLPGYLGPGEYELKLIECIPNIEGGCIVETAEVISFEVVSSGGS